MNSKRSLLWRNIQSRRQRQRQRQRRHDRLCNPSSMISTCSSVILLILYCNNNQQEYHCFVSSFQAATPISTFDYNGGLSRRQQQQHQIQRNHQQQRRRQTIQFVLINGSKTLEDDRVAEQHREPNYCALNLDDFSEPFMTIENSESTFLEYSEDGLCLPAGPVGQAKEVTANFLTEPSVEIIIAAVVLFNSLLVALSTLDSLSNFSSLIRNGEIIIGMVFLIDFIARWFSSSRDEGGFILDIQFVIDILVVILPLASYLGLFGGISFLPTSLSQPSGLFNLQLLRVLRLQRFLQDLDTFEKFTGTNNIVKDWQLQLARVVLSLFTLLSVSSGLIYTAEHVVNPNINNYFDALYFGLTTLTTVGFGDVSPVTWQGRLVVCGSIIVGVGVVPAQAAALLEALLDRENIKSGSGGWGGFGSARKSTSSTATSSMISTNTMNSNRSNDDDNEAVLALNTKVSCDRCGASFHWSSARYCYSCGEEL